MSSPSRSEQQQSGLPTHSGHSQGESHVWTVTTTPFSLASDHPHEDDTMSVSSSTYTATEGIDVLGAEGGHSSLGIVEWARIQSGWIVTSQTFKRGLLALVLINSAVLAIRTWDVVRQQEHALVFCNKLVRFFLLVFSTELAVELAHYQKRTLRKGWVLLDIFILTIAWAISDSLLILRAFRLIRALRKASGMTDLKNSVKALLRLLPKICALAVILSLVLFIFAVLFTAFFQELYETNQISQDWFTGLDRSAYTLFQMLTAGVLWNDVAAEVAAVYPHSSFLFVAYITVGTVLLSLAVALAVDAVTTITQERMIKSLEGTGSHSPHSETWRNKQPLQPPPRDFAYGNTNSGVSKDEFHRLERKLDDLTVLVEQMSRQQVALQGTMQRQAQHEVARNLARTASG